MSKLHELYECLRPFNALAAAPVVTAPAEPKRANPAPTPQRQRQ